MTAERPAAIAGVTRSVLVRRFPRRVSSCFESAGIPQTNDRWVERMPMAGVYADVLGEPRQVPGVRIRLTRRQDQRMPRAYWKGHLRLSLVTCPIELFPATSQSEKTHFHQINTKTGHRLRQQMVDEETGQVVDSAHKGRGYELGKGRYVPIEEEELKAVQVESTHTVDIDGFVPKAEIDQRYLDKPYYIAPAGKVGAEAFAVIRDAMKDQDRVALARVVMAHREHVIALGPLGK